MDFRCRVCRLAPEHQLLPISAISTGTSEKKYSDLLTAIIEKKLVDDLPQYLCNRCIESLETAYSVLEYLRRCNLHVRCKQEEEQKFLRCRCCFRADVNELISLFGEHEQHGVRICDMMHYMASDHIVEVDDQLPPYICDSCFYQLEVGYYFKIRCLESEQNLRSWERMEYQTDNFGHLVVELSATAITLWEVRKKGKLYEKIRLEAVCCSMCKLKVDIENIDGKCAGCQLQFSNMDEVRNSIEQHKWQQQQDEPVEKGAITWEVISQNDVDDGFNQDTLIEMDCEWDDIFEAEEKYDPTQEADVRSLKKPDLFKFFASANLVRNKKGDTFQELKRKGAICCECEIIFPSFLKLKEHAKKEHKIQDEEDGTNRCKVCYKNFPTTDALNNHAKIWTQKYYKYCTACEVLLDMESEFQHRIEKHMTEQDKASALTMVANETKTVYRCCVPNCCVVCSSEKSLLAHQNQDHQHWKETFGSNDCQYCRSKFDSEADFLKHCDRKQEQPVYGCRVFSCTFQNVSKAAAICHCFQGQHETKFRKTQNSETATASEPQVLALKTAKKSFSPKYRLAGSRKKHFSFRQMESKNVELLELKSQFCCGCFSMFERTEDLRKHVREVHPKVVDNDSPHRCEKCNSTFKNATALESHCRHARNTTFYYCRPCEKLCNNQHQLNIHKAFCPFNKEEGEEDHANEYYDVVQDECFVCCGCDAKFGCEEDLIGHRNQEHPGDGTHDGEKPICSNCYRVFANRTQLKTHVQAYADRTTFKCKVSLCVFETKFLTSMKHHAFRKSHTSPQGEQFTLERYNPSAFECCGKNCDFKIASYDDLIQHGLERHAHQQQLNKLNYNNREVPFPCPVCGKAFDAEYKLLVHQRSKTTRCDKCWKFMDKSRLEAHSKICNKAPYKPTESSSSSKPVSLQSKIKLVCTICGKSYNKYKMVEHMNIHENKRIWKCDFCPASFNSKTVRYTHMQNVHSETKAYECRQGCENRYKNRTDRDRHEKMVHLGIKPFSCADCGKTFPRNRELQLHRRIHTGRKLYTCNGCRAEYDKWSELEEHRRECANAQCE